MSSLKHHSPVEVDSEIQTEWRAHSSALDGEDDGEVVGRRISIPVRKSEANLDGLLICHVPPRHRTEKSNRATDRVTRTCIFMCGMR